MTTDITPDTSSEDVSGLKSKITELFGKLKAAEKRAEDAEAANEELADKAAAGDDLAKLQREYAKLEKALTAITGERDTLAADLRTTRVDGAISAAIASGNVRPEMVEAVEAILHRKAQYEDGTATIEGKSIADFAKGYFAKDGAHFIRAADNAGADAIGNNGSKPVEPHGFTKDNFSSRMGEWAVRAGTDPEWGKSVAIECGRGDLAATL